MRYLMILLALSLGILFTTSANAQAEGKLIRDLPAGLQIPDAARPGPNFDVDRATESYIDLLSPEQRAKSDDYFEGGYWLQLWSFLYTLGVSALLLASGWSRKMRETAQRISHRPWLYTLIYAAFWILSLALLTLPLSLYADFYREHQYGLATQTLGPWLGDQAKDLLVNLIFLPWIIMAIYAAVRRLGGRWWVAAGALSFVFVLVISMIAPVFISPLFNKYQPLADGPVRSSILSLARANQIPTDHVEWFDASKQTTRISANVSGFAGTTRVNLNDNLMNRTSLPEIKAVMGHEMGHYVLNHGLRLSIYLGLLVLIGFWFVHRSFDWAYAHWGRRFGVEGIGDPAGLPLAIALFSTFFFLATPVSNTIGRQAEAEADAFGLNAAREPNGFATAAMRLSTYRKIRPGKWEEIIFYDHPSGYTRVHSAMLWLKENQDNPTANAPLPPMPPIAPAATQATP
jgi:STE24 endopeptidase